EEAERLRQAESNWKIEEMKRLNAERTRWEAEAERRLSAAEKEWRDGEEQRLAEAAMAWRSGTDRIAAAKMRLTTEALRQEAELNPRRGPSWFTGKRITLIAVLLAMAGGGYYAYQSGMVDQVVSSLTAPTPEPEPVTVVPEAPAPAREPARPVWQLKPEYASANLRAQPSTGAPVIASVGRDSELVELERDGNWLRIALPDGNEGWIHTNLLTGGAPGQ
ncbi:MAG: SH3 domain-containing protein, partial [Dongiaceae bacterium]